MPAKDNGMPCNILQMHKVLTRAQEATKKLKVESSLTDIKMMINQGQKFSDELLKVCTARVEDKASKVCLGRDLGFNHKVAPCRLVVPFQTMLTPSLPINHSSDYLKTFRAFPRDTVIIESMFLLARLFRAHY